MNKIFQGDVIDVLRKLPSESVHSVVTSPPYYGLRDYGVKGQIGLEDSPEQFVQKMVDVFREVRRVLRKDGTLWLNLGDSYVGTGDKGNYRDPKYPEGRNGQSKSKNKTVTGLKKKDLIGIPWRVAFALQADGWYLRQDIIWNKPNPMPESVQDRCTKAHEYIFLMSKSPKYFYDIDAVREPFVTGEDKQAISRKYEAQKMGNLRNRSKEKYGLTQGKSNKSVTHPNGKNKRSVWTVTPRPYKEAHFATFPEALIDPCVRAGVPTGGVVLDPFFGSGTTGVVAMKQGKKYIGIELNPAYIKIAKKRLS